MNSDQIDKALEEWAASGVFYAHGKSFRAGWEAALRSKPQGEPVAWRFMVDGQWFTGRTREACRKAIANFQIDAEIEPLYAAPPADGVVEALQAKIDALMLEYCPDEMTPEQIANWERHQVPAPKGGE